MRHNVDRILVSHAAPIKYVGQAAVADVANLRAAIQGKDMQGYIAALGPLSLGAGIHNLFYKTEEEYLPAVTDARRPQDQIRFHTCWGSGHRPHVNDIELVAERIVRYAKLVGRENVQTGTDCGIGWRVGHEEVVWAKLQAMSEGAAIASKRLWNN